jgi:hypothetical protein
MRGTITVVLAVVLGAACRSGPAPPRGGRLSVRMSMRDTIAPTTGRDSGARTAGRDTIARGSRRDTAAAVAFTASAVAEWCDSLGMLQIRAMTGDTGVALALYPAERPEPGVYPIRQPDVADTTRPPSAAVALRWLSKTAVQGFQGESGSVTLTRGPDGALGGVFHGWGHGVPVATRLTLAGSFEGVRPVPARTGCAGAPSGDTTRAAEPAGEDDDSTSGVD